LTIRNIDEALKRRLRVRAAEHGHSMEEEARRILPRHLEPTPPPERMGLGSAIHARFAALGGVDIPEVEHEIATCRINFDSADFDP
jgi:plasmid stability protein